MRNTKSKSENMLVLFIETEVNTDFVILGEVVYEPRN